MSRQIAVRIPEELVEFVDEQVRDGRATSRADAVIRALTRERRLERATQDLAILLAEREVEDPDQLDELVEYVHRSPIE